MLLDYELPEFWSIAWACDKSRRYHYDPGGGIHGFVMLNQSTANMQWTVSRSRDSHTAGQADVIAYGIINLQRPELTMKPLREISARATMELVEYMVHNSECFEGGDE